MNVFLSTGSETKTEHRIVFHRSLVETLVDTLLLSWTHRDHPAMAKQEFQG